MEYIRYFIELNQRIDEMKKEQDVLLDSLRKGQILPVEYGKLSKPYKIDALQEFSDTVRFYAQRELKQFLIEKIKESKIANKPTHYKVFKDFISSLSIDGLKIYTYQTSYYSQFSVYTSNFYNSCTNIETCLYLSDDKTINWNDINNKRVDLPTLPPKELEKKFFKRLAEKNKLVAEIEEKLTNFNNEWDRVGYFTKERLSCLLKSDYI